MLPCPREDALDGIENALEGNVPFTWPRSPNTVRAEAGSA